MLARNLATKFICLGILTAMLPIMLFSFLLINQQGNSIRRETLQRGADDVRQMAARLDTVLVQLRNINNFYYFDPDIADLVRKDGTTIAQDKLAQKKLFAKYKTGPNSLDFHTLVVRLDGKVYGDADCLEDFSITAFQNRPIYQDIVQNTGEVLWRCDNYLDAIFDAEETHVFLIRQMYDYNTWKVCGMVITGISTQALRHEIQIDLQEDRSYYLLAPTGQVVDALDGLRLHRPTYWNMQKYPQTSGGEIVDADNQVIHYDTLESNRWKIVRYGIPTGFSNISMYYIVFGISFMCLMSACLFVVIRRWMQPLQMLNQTMKLVREGDLDARVQPQTKDEIGQLTEEFNHMVAHIRELLEKVEWEQEQKRKLELFSLKMQINPHFLYNTLASIRYIAQLGDTEKVDQALIRLIRLLRNTLSTNDEFISVHQEIANLKNYMEIQQIGRKKPFTVRFSVSPELEDCMIMKMLLQPLVENAIEHGIKNQDNGEIWIAGSSDGGDMLLDIRDNGAGMDLTKHPFQPDAIDYTMTDRIALQNVQSRIRLHFGKKYGLTLQSEPGKGTWVRIRLPKIQQERSVEIYEHPHRG